VWAGSRKTSKLPLCQLVLTVTGDTEFLHSRIYQSHSVTVWNLNILLNHKCRSLYRVSFLSFFFFFYFA
jgi:hypothetical protein